MVINKTLRYSIIAIITLIALIIGKKILAFFQNGGNVSDLFFSKTDPSGQEVNMPLSIENPADITKETAKQLAERLFGAMDKVGTDVKAIFEILHPERTNNDIINIYNSFGFRKYILFGYDALFGTKLNLVDWLRAELSKSDFEKIRPLFANAKII